MGMWAKLFGLPGQSTTLRGHMVRGDEFVAVVGESRYQHALRSICGRDNGQEVRHDCLAVLVPEPTNEYDPNAVYIEIAGKMVGYLSRDDAVEYKAAVQRFQVDGKAIMCEARIAGRAKGDRDTANVGVWLFLPTADAV